MPKNIDISTWKEFKDKVESLGGKDTDKIIGIGPFGFTGEITDVMWDEDSIIICMR